MRKDLSICTILLLASLSVTAQGHGPSHSVPGVAHSNAPHGTPAASTDRDTGKARAEDVGKGKKEGLADVDTGKKKGHKKHHKDQLKKG